MKKSNGKTDLYQVVTNRIIDLLESQKLTWDRPWVMIASDGKRAHNASSGRAYSGINWILLSLAQNEHGYAYGGWLTFVHVKHLGGKVISGSKSTQILFNKPVYYDKDGNKYESEEMEEMSVDEQSRCGLSKRFVLKYYNVFNVAQTSGLADSFYEIKEMPTVCGAERDIRAEHLINSTDAIINHKPSNEAHYNSLEDVIHLPDRKQFKGQEAYYETALHELAHWSGHESRLNRDILNMFGTPEYAKEELVAELCSSFLCAELGFTNVITNNAAYIQNWINALKEDHRYIFMVVRNAEKAAVFIQSTMSEYQE
jgi:antirestriction protein ArdC